VNDSLGPFSLILLAIPAVALRLAVRALFGGRRMAAADPMQLILSLASVELFILAGLGLVVSLVGISFAFIPVPFLFLIVILMVIDRSRRMEHRSLLWTLSAAAQRGVPLSEAARAYADESLGDTGLRSLALAEAMERGEPLWRAVCTARLRLGVAPRLAVRMGEQLGLLGPAMRQQLDDSQQVDAVLRDTIGRFFYLGNVVAVMLIVSTFVMLRIVPVFQKMFEEFGLKLPAMTILLIEISKWYVLRGWWLTIPLTLLAPLFLFFGFLYYIGWVPRDLPLVWRLFRRYDGALVMRSLALAIRRGMPLPQAMQLTADCYPISIVASLLRKATERVQAGMNWRESLLQTRLISTADAAVLGAAERVGNLEWALEEMADSAMRRMIYRVQALLQILFPILLLVLGFVVMFFVTSLFLPLIALIQGLA